MIFLAVDQKATHCCSVPDNRYSAPSLASPLLHVEPEAAFVAVHSAFWGNSQANSLKGVSGRRYHEQTSGSGCLRLPAGAAPLQGWVLTRGGPVD